MVWQLWQKIGDPKDCNSKAGEGRTIFCKIAHSLKSLVHFNSSWVLCTPKSWSKSFFCNFRHFFLFADLLIPKKSPKRWKQFLTHKSWLTPKCWLSPWGSTQFSSFWFIFNVWNFSGQTLYKTSTHVRLNPGVPLRLTVYHWAMCVPWWAKQKTTLFSSKTQ